MLLQKEMKMPRTVFIYVLLISLFITGCGQSSTPEPLHTPRASALPASDSEWTIKMNHSGGIMGLMRSIEVSSDGKFTIIDEQANKTIAGELSTEELSKINEQVISSKYIPASKTDGMGCADCFVYDLEIHMNRDGITVQLNDINLPKSGLEPLVRNLRGLIDTALK
jgi:hypothetical protein